MIWNIAIAVTLAALTALVTGLAGHLAATKPWHKWLFWGTGAAMIVLIGIQTYRNEVAQQDLRAQLDKIQKNTETPPKVEVNVSSPPNRPVKPHARIVFENPGLVTGSEAIPPKVGLVPKLNVSFRAMDAAADENELEATVVIIPVERINDRTAFSKYSGEIKKKTFGGTMVPGEVSYHTFLGEPLTEQNVSDLLNAKAGMCAIGFMRWSDGTGSYETDAGHCVMAESTGEWNWHVLVENNRERQIQ